MQDDDIGGLSKNQDACYNLNKYEGLINTAGVDEHGSKLPVEDIARTRDCLAPEELR